MPLSEMGLSDPDRRGSYYQSLPRCHPRAGSASCQELWVYTVSAVTGSYGKDVKGLNRLHQFDKVELVQVVHPDHHMRPLRR